MQIAQVVFRQRLVMTLYMMLGMGLYKGGKISRQGSKDMATLLLYLVIPAVLVNSFCGIAATPRPGASWRSAVFWAGWRCCWP